MNPLEPFLKKQSVCIVDGGFGSELASRGYDLGDSLWSAGLLVHNSQAIAKVHLDYLQAGADIIITASYQASIEGFMARGMSKDEAVKLMQFSVELAQKTRDEFWQNCSDSKRLKPLVAASIGPYGAFLADGSEYRGDYRASSQELYDFHYEKMKALVEAKPDILAIETIPSLDEAKIIVEVLEHFPDAKAWLCFSAKDEGHTCKSDSIIECAKWLENRPQIVALGINCTAPQHISSLTKSIKKHSSKPIILYPNGGGAYDPASKSWQTPPELDHTSLAKIWHKEGARLIGGCCQTTPKDIAKLSSWVRGEFT